MKTPEEIEELIEQRLKKVELEVDKRLQQELKEGTTIKELIELVYHLRNPKLMPDNLFYEKIKDNDLAVMVDNLTDNLALVKKVTKICNKAKEKLKIPRDLDKENLDHLLNNKK